MAGERGATGASGGGWHDQKGSNTYIRHCTLATMNFMDRIFYRIIKFCIINAFNSSSAN